MWTQASGKLAQKDRTGFIDRLLEVNSLVPVRVDVIDLTQAELMPTVTTIST